jgi:paraquat-inducible protein B
MSKPASKTLIGLFVVGAVALAVIAVALFGSGKFFSKRPKFVMFFPGSVNGLVVGSPVQFRGVKIGEVTTISAHFNPKDLSVVIPVYIELDPKSMTLPDKMRKMVSDLRYTFFQRMVAKGLKAQLRMKSLITGQLYIAIDFYPEKPIQLMGLDTRYPEIPTVASASDVLMATLEQVPLAEISKNLLKVSEGVERIVNSPQTRDSLKNMNESINQLNSLIRKVDAEVRPVAKSIRSATDAALGAFSQAEKTLAFNEGVPGKFAESLQVTLEKVGTTLEEMRGAIASYETIAKQNANIGYDVGKTLREIEAAARSIRSLTDYLERHPEALVKGKKPAKGE